MERVFWLLLGRDSASVKKIMEEFQQSHRHYLSENHRRLVPIVQHLLHLLYPGMLYRLHVQLVHTPFILLLMYPSALLLVVTGFINWNSDWWRHPGDHEEMLGGQPVCAVSTHSCGCMASLPLSPQHRAQQVLFSYMHARYFWLHSKTWISRVSQSVKS